MCNDYCECDDYDFSDDEPREPEPIECPFGCGEALAVKRWGDHQLRGDSLMFRSWADLPCGHEGDKRILTMPLGVPATGQTGVAALMERTPTEQKVVDLEPWTDPDRAPIERRKPPGGRLFNWLNAWLRR